MFITIILPYYLSAIPTVHCVCLENVVAEIGMQIVRIAAAKYY